MKRAVMSPHSLERKTSHAHSHSHANLLPAAWLVLFLGEIAHNRCSKIVQGVCKTDQLELEISVIVSTLPAYYSLINWRRGYTSRNTNGYTRNLISNSRSKSRTNPSLLGASIPFPRATLSRFRWASTSRQLLCWPLEAMAFLLPPRKASARQQTS